VEWMEGEREIVFLRGMNGLFVYVEGGSIGRGHTDLWASSLTVADSKCLWAVDEGECLRGGDAVNMMHDPDCNLCPF